MASAARTARPYYVVASRFPGLPWGVEFGDYVRRVALDELRDMKDGDKRYPRAERREFACVTAIDGRQTAVDAAVATLNAKG